MIKYILLLSILLFCVNSTFAQFAPAPPQKGDNPPQTSAVIVKFKEKAQLEFSKQGELFKTNYPEMDALNKLYRIQKIERVFKNVPSLQIAEGRSRIQKIQQRFPQRANRAPKDAIIPDLAQVYRFDLPEEADAEAIARKYAELPIVEYAEPNRVVHTYRTPNDPYFNSSGTWGQPYADMWGLHKIQAEQAWDVHTGSPQIVVAVTDTGVDYRHEDIVENLWENAGEIPDDSVDNDGNGYIDDVRGWDFYSSDNDPMDGHGHGTHVSGTIAAVANNGIGVAGISWQSLIMPLKGLSDWGEGYDDDLAAAIVYAADNGADIVNMSWGGLGRSSLLEDALDYAHALGCILVAAAGNENDDAANHSPANVPQVITASAFDYNDQKASFSNWGVKIDVAAPGVDILSLRADGTGSPDYVVGEKYYRMSGTSMAAPHVCGLAALILSKNPNFTNEEVRQIIRTTADDVDVPGWDIYAGYGRINAAKALQVETISAAYIESPMSGSVHTTDIAIIGTASGPKFMEYLVEYGVGKNPSNWAFIHHSTTQVIDGTLANWDTRPVTDGEYTIRLTVVDLDGMEFSYRVGIFIDHLSIFQPQRVYSDVFQNYRAIVDKKQIVTITGIAYNIEFDHYEVKYSTDKTNWMLVKSSTTPVSNGVLAEWDATGLLDGDYTIRLEGYKKTGLWDSDSVDIVLQSYQSGWPKDTGYTIASAPVVVDLDGDNVNEIIAINFNGEIYVWHPDGTLLPGWPTALGHKVACSPAVGNIDGDGDLEIVVQSDDSLIYALHHDGSIVAGWPRKIYDGPDVWVSPTLADLNHDGALEIIYGGWDIFYVFSGDGSNFPGWAKNIYDYFEYTSAAGDLDGDGNIEIIAPAGYSLNVWKSDGTPLSGWPKTIWDTNFSPSGVAVLGNLDSDEAPEILINTDLGDDYIFKIFNSDGTEVAGAWLQGESSGFPSLADVDGDKDLEIVGRKYIDGTKIVVWHHDGTPVTGWPRFADSVKAGLNYYAGSPLVGDINGDGQMEIVIPSTNKLFAWHHDGTPVQGWPKQTGDWIWRTPTLADVDKDGDIEVIATSGDGIVHIWDLDGKYDLEKIEWGMAFHDQWHTNSYNFGSGKPPAFSLRYPVDHHLEITQTPTFEWQYIPRPDGGPLTFSLYYSTEIDFPTSSTTVIEGINGSRYTPAEPLEDYTTYFWKVAATNSIGITTWSREIWSFNINTKLIAPTQLSSESGMPYVPLTWDAPAPLDETFSHYNVYRSDTVGGPYQLLKADVAETTYTDTEVIDDQTYYYVVAAVYSEPHGGESNYSNETHATVIDRVPPATVKDLAATNITNHTVTLIWTAPGDNDTKGVATVYDIRYSTNPVGGDIAAWWKAAQMADGEPKPATAGTSESFILRNLEKNTTYYLAMKTADDVLNWSEISNIVVPKTVNTTFYNTAFEANLLSTDALCGAAFGDYDNDGDLDILVTDMSIGIFLHQNKGNGTFTDVSLTSGLNATGISQGLALGDYDNDGWLDIYVTGKGGILYHNDGDATFTDVTSHAGVVGRQYSNGSIFGDYDNDGYLDIYVTSFEGNVLFHNNGNGTFTDVTETTGVSGPSSYNVVFGDYDNDGDLDLYVPYPGANHLYKNNGDGTFTDVTEIAGVGHAGGSTVAVFGDYDNDGDLDFYVGGTGEGDNVLYQNNGDGTFTDVTKSVGIQSIGVEKNAAFGDYDNDGDLDLYITSSPSVLYRNNGDGTFTNIAVEAGVDDRESYGVTMGDYDNDGDLDICVAARPDVILYRNEGNWYNHWLHIKTVGTVSNWSGIGARVKVVSGELSQIREVSGGSGICQDSLPVEFGLGDHTKADVIEIRWPSGLIQTFADVPADQFLVITEGKDTLDITYGDVSMNGIVSAYDASLILQHVVNLIELSPAQQQRADVTGNHQITAYDAALVLQYTVGLIDKFPIESQSISPSIHAFGDTTRLEITSSAAKAGGRVTVPIRLYQSGDVFSGQFTLKYPVDWLKLINVSKADSFSQSDFEHQINSGTVQCAFAQKEALKGDVTIAQIEFEILSNVPAGTHIPLRLMDTSVNETILSNIRDSAIEILPEKTALLQNYPNPFNPETWIPYQLASDSPVTIRVYNTRGQLIRALNLGLKKAGIYVTKDKSVYWDGTNNLSEKVASGVYFYQLQAEEFRATRKMVIIK